MAVFKIEKVIGAVPETIEPNCIYLVRTGAGFDLYASDTTGAIAHALNGGAASGGINDLLSIPLARLDYFDHAIVIQDGELRRMPYADFIEATQPDFNLAPDNALYIEGSTIFDADGEYLVYLVYENVDNLVYDDCCVASGEFRLVYPGNEVLVYGDEILYYGDEELIHGVDGP